jgi:mono/diheme cytochrome c family protein
MRLSIPLRAALAFLWAGACTGEFETQQRGESDVNPPQSRQADAGPPAVTGADYFQVNILPILSTPRPKGACAICHQGANPADGPDFLGPNAETNYATLLASPGLVGDTSSSSSLYTRGNHDGDAFLLTEYEMIAMWISLEQ